MESYITTTGYVGSRPELRTTRTGVPCATFRLGSTPRKRVQGEWQDGETTWMTVTCYRNLAEHVSSSLNKGDPVLVDGRVRTERWQDASGQAHERVVVEAVTVGHDLSRGTASFRREQRAAEPAERVELDEGDGAEAEEVPTADDARSRALAGQEGVRQAA